MLAAHLGRGEHEQVVRLAENGLRDKPADAALMTLMANSLDALGQRDRAAKIRERLLSQDADDRESLFLLGRYHEERGEHDEASTLYARFLQSKAPVYPLGKADYRLLRFLARLLGVSGKRVENQARTTSRRLEEEGEARRLHAVGYLATVKPERSSHDA